MLFRSKRDNELMNNVRKQFINSKDEITSLVDSFKSQFDIEDEFEKMYSFMLEFFKIIEDDSKFDKLILKQARTK